MHQTINQILEVIGLGVAGVLVKVIKIVGDEAIEYLQKKKQTEEQKYNIDKYSMEIQMAKQVWNIIEEKYRIKENLEVYAETKAQAFDKLLLSKCPYLTEDELKDLRQAVAGEVNKGKQALIDNKK